MSSAWIAFARTEDPTVEALPSWPKYTLQKRATLLFDNQSSLVDNPFGELSAWEGVAVQDV
jgi:para-nitrobenzyl esterase